MDEKDVYFMGTIIEIANPMSLLKDIEKYMLVECHEQLYQFQIICISGYNAGQSFGFIFKDPLLKDHFAAITKNHLLSEIRKNFGDISIDRISIIKNS